MPFQHAVDADGDVNLYPLSALPPSPSHHDGLDCSAPMKRGPSVFNCPPSPSDSAQIASLTFSPRRAPALDPSQDRPYKRPKLEEDMSDSEGSTYPVHILHRPVPDAQPSLPHPQDSNMPFASSFAGFGANSSSSSSFVSAQPSIKFASSSFTNPPSVSPNRSPFSTQSAPLALGPTSNTIWFEDGDLVLGVQDVFFRVHASRLVASAGAFAALVDAPRLLPTDREAGARAAEEISRKVRAEVHAGSSADVGVGAEYVDGCPFVPLDDDDSPRDWAVALEAMYDFLTFQIRPVIFDTLASALRISTKYDVRFLREWAIAQMRTTWPTHLDQMAPMALPHAADAIALARQCCVPEILPAAFYALSVQKWRSGADGGRAHAVLAPADLRRLVAGREALQDVLVDIVVAPLTLSPSMGCFVTGEMCGIPSSPTLGAEGGGYKGENYWTPEGVRLTRPRTAYPPSPAPSPSPKSPTMPSTHTRAPQAFTPSASSSITSPSPSPSSAPAAASAKSTTAKSTAAASSSSSLSSPTSTSTAPTRRAGVL